MGRLWRLSVVVIVLTLAPMQAWAECAWVLWRFSDATDVSLVPKGWELVTSFDANDKCELGAKQRAVRIKSAADQTGDYATASITELPGLWRVEVIQKPSAFYPNGQVTVDEFKCFPDTIDPRGPKGGAR